MKKILFIALIISSIAFAQDNIDPDFLVDPNTEEPNKKEEVNKDSIEVSNLQRQLMEISKTIITIQSEVYERKERLEKLYTNYSYLTDMLRLKKELIEEKKKSKVK